MSEEARRSLTIGVDLGQRADYTAIAVAEGWRQPRPLQEGAQQLRAESHFVVRSLERLDLGTNYLAVAQRLRQVVAQVRLRSGHDALAVYVDATGVGVPVLDVLRQVQLRAALMPVWFTSTDRLVEVREQPKGLGAPKGRVIELRCGKAHLVSRLQALLQGRQLHLPRALPSAAAVREEMLAYEIRASQDGGDTFGAFNAGSHDDLVTAIGLAVLREPASNLASLSRTMGELRATSPRSGMGDVLAGGSWPRSW